MVTHVAPRFPGVLQLYSLCIHCCLLFKFCEIQNFITSVIIGATTLAQLKTNIDSVEINLNKEIIKKIEEIQRKYPNPCP